jgi:type VI secretion system protein ImpK
MSLVNNFSDVFAYVVGLQRKRFKGYEVDDVQLKINNLFDAIKKQCLVSYGELEYTQCLFAICAWIDELVLCTSWDQKHLWKKQLLQHLYFDTTRAGEQFYEKLDSLRAGQTDVSEVYLYCLKLGFKGKYYMSRDRITLTEKANTLYQLVIAKHGEELNKPMVNCTLSPKALVQNSKSPLDLDYKKKGLWAKSVWWFVPIIPFAIVTIVFSQVLQSMVMEYLKRFN